MSHEASHGEHNEYNEIEQLKESDIQYNKVSSSHFLFYLTLFALISFVVGCSTQLYHHSYKGKPDVTIQSSTQYTPEYK